MMSSQSEYRNLNAFYRKIEKVSSEWPDDRITPSEKTIALLRVAFESGMEDLGATGVLYLVSHMMTTTLGVMNDVNSESSLDEILDGFECDRNKPN